MNYPLSDKGNPSEITEIFWLNAFRKIGNYPSTRNMKGGKWLIFEDKKNIDLIWEKIKLATEKGFLGGNSKVSTSKPNRNSSNPNQPVICVHTYDSGDKDDVMRIRQELRSLGVLKEIPYKTDEKTSDGDYKNKGGKNISLYYE